MANHSNPLKAENLNSLVGEAFQVAYAKQRALLESRRTVAQNQTSANPSEDNIRGTAPNTPPTFQSVHSPQHHPPLPPLPPVASTSVQEVDSGIATTDAAFFRQRIDMLGYHAADSGLR